MSPELNTKTKYPWPGYFIVRTTGEVVPLIAMDELPPGVELMGVPRSIELEETIGMLNLGLQKSCGAYYSIAGLGSRGSTMTIAEIEGRVAKTIDQFPQRHKENYTNAIPDSTSQTTLNSRGHAAHPTSSTSTNSSFVLAKSPLLQTQTQTHPTTQLCRHWCHHGICKWGQQCRYRHIMPMTLLGLQEVGLTDWPVWYRELNPVYFVSEMMTAANAYAPGSKVAGRGYRRARTSPFSGVFNGCDIVGTCCDDHNTAGHNHVKNGSGVGTGKAERLRGGNKIVGKDRAMRSEELGEQIITRLKKMERDAKAKEEKERISSSVVMERAQARETRRWEDESDTGEEGDEGDIDSETEARETCVAVKQDGKLVEV